MHKLVLVFSIFLIPMIAVAQTCSIKDRTVFIDNEEADSRDIKLEFAVETVQRLSEAGLCTVAHQGKCRIVDNTVFIGSEKMDDRDILLEYAIESVVLLKSVGLCY